MENFITYSADNFGCDTANIICYKDDGGASYTGINRVTELYEIIQKMEEQIAQLERAVKILSARIQ